MWRSSKRTSGFAGCSICFPEPIPWLITASSRAAPRSPRSLAPFTVSRKTSTSLLSPDFLGWKESDLEEAPSRTQRRKRIEALEAACSDAVENQFRPLIESAIVGKLGQRTDGNNWLSYELDEGTRSPVLLFSYPTERSTGSQSYIPPRVKLEFGSLTDQKPTGSRGTAQIAFLCRRAGRTFGTLGRADS